MNLSLIHIAADFALPGGQYARLFYRGSYRRLGERVDCLLYTSRCV